MVSSVEAPVEPAPITLTVGAAITIDPAAPVALRRVIGDALTVENPAYREAEERGRSTRDLEPELRYYRQADDGALVVPRGAGDIVRALCKEHGVGYTVAHETVVAEPVVFAERVTLSAAQERAVGEMLARRTGVLCAPAGSGKTVMAMAMIARRQQPAVVIVHTRELAHQAIARAVAVLGLDEAEIGLIGDGQCRVGARLTVALVQSLARGIPPALRRVGFVLVDEAHHCPALQMMAVVSQFPARFIAGMTATPYRRDGLDRVIHFFLGETRATIDAADLADRLVHPRVIKRETGLRPEGDSFSEIVGQLVADRARNALIVGDIVRGVKVGRRCLVLSDRVEHVEELTRLLRAEGVAAAALHGRLGKKVRAQVVEDLATGALDVAVATGSLVGEGFDCPRLDTLFLATPVSFRGRVVQYIGRVSRSAPGKTDAIVMDYCDDNQMLWSTFRNRLGVYRTQQQAGRAA